MRANTDIRYFAQVAAGQSMPMVDNASLATRPRPGAGSSRPKAKFLALAITQIMTRILLGIASIVLQCSGVKYLR